MPRLDVLTATDCRLPGGTATSTAEELEAQRRGGLSSGLLHLDSPLVSRTRPLNPRLRAALERGATRLVFPDEEMTARVLLLRHPKVALGLDTIGRGRLSVDHCVVLVNQVPMVDGRVVYRADEVNAVVESVVGSTPLWSPIGPLVRREFLSAEPGQSLTADDWYNIIDVDAWSVERRAPDPTCVRIGRHSRDHWLKWPGTREAMLAAYPDADDIVVRVLGGIPQALTVLGGRTPSNWEPHDFGSLSPRRFLAGIDVYVYMHHEQLTEAFGRNLLEAMASGAPVVTDPKFEPLFGGAVWYSEPPGVLALVRELAGDPDLYIERSRQGQRFAREHFGYEHHLDRLGTLAGVAATVEPRRPVAVAPVADERRTTVLFVSPNGAGMGHLTRLLAVAKRLAPNWSAHFLTFSTAASIVEREGFPVDYVASRPVTSSSSTGWHDALAVRLRDLVDELSPSAVVIDGTEPYRGLLRAMVDRPEVAIVWSRRGMWRPGVSNPVLETAEPFFDLIVEPGDAAAAHDIGATSRSAAGRRIPPVTYVPADEMLGRDDARRELGLPLEGQIALVTVGAGNINDTDVVTRTVADVAARYPDLVVATTRSPIALNAAGVSGAISISLYPLARCLAAFDVAVAAAGYNSFHELLQANIPTLFVPNESTITDDQVRRANWAEASGVALMASERDPASIRSALEQLLSPEVGDRLRTAMVDLEWSDGGTDFVTELERLGATSPGERATIAGQRREAFARLEQRVLQRSTSGTVEARPSGPREWVKRLARVLIGRMRRLLGDTRAARLLGRAPVRVQRRVERLMTGGTRKQRGKSPLLNTPTGRWISHEQSNRLSVVLLDVDPDVDLDAMLDHVAHLQMVERTFTPIVLSSSLGSAPAFRRHGYVFEHVRRRCDEESAEAYAGRRAARLAQVRRWYRPSFIVSVRNLDDVGSTSLLARLVRGLDPT